MKPSKNFIVLSVVFCLLPVAIYLVFFKQIALNINYIAYDDLHVLDVINQWKQHPDWASRFHFLTVGFPEHRIVFTRSNILLSYWLTGGVKLTNLMLLSNSLWLGQLVILYFVFKQTKLSLWYFVPVCWLLLNVQSFENVFWGTSSVGNFGLLFFTTAAIYCFTQPFKYSFGLSLFFATCAMFSYGNGLAVFVVMGLYLLLSHQWQRLVVLIVVFGAIMFVYSFTVANAPPAALDLTKLSSYPLALSCFFGFLGGSVNFNPNIYAETTFELWSSVIWGLGLFATFVFVFKNHLFTLLKNKFSKPLKLSPTEQFLLLFFLFVCITAVGVVYKRSGADFLPGMFKGRYKMYSTWLVVVVYMAWVNYSQQKLSTTKLLVALGLAIGINLFSLFSFLPAAVNNRRAAVAVEFNSMNNADIIGLKMFDLTQQDFFRIQSVYRPEIPFEDIPQKLNLPIQNKMQLDTAFCDKGNFLVLWRKDFLPIQKDFTDGAYVVLKSQTHIYIANGAQEHLPLKTFLRRGWYWDRGFTAMFQGEAAEDGTYDVYVLLRKNGQNELYQTTPALQVKRVGKQGFSELIKVEPK